LRFEDRIDKTEAEAIREKITSLRELIAKSQSGESEVSAEEMKTKTDELQQASLTLFDKMHKAKAESNNSEQQQQGEQKQDGEGEKKP
jgi:molecular chaperone DnaK